jgi:hypothetical protein
MVGAADNYGAEAVQTTIVDSPATADPYAWLASMAHRATPGLLAIGSRARALSGCMSPGEARSARSVRSGGSARQ